MEYLDALEITSSNARLGGNGSKYEPYNVRIFALPLGLDGESLPRGDDFPSNMRDDA